MTTDHSPPSPETGSPKIHTASLDVETQASDVKVISTPAVKSVPLPNSDEDEEVVKESRVTESGKGKGKLEGNENEVKEVKEVKEEKEEIFNLCMTWQGKSYEVTMGSKDLVAELASRIHVLTQVPADRQKYIGLSKVKPADNGDKPFTVLRVKDGARFTMIGTPEKDTFVDPKHMTLPDVMDDFDIAYPTTSEPSADPGTAQTTLAPADNPKYQKLLRSIIKAHPLNYMNEPREGKRLLVLDLDYTIIDTKPLIAGSLPADECVRPGMHEFLELVYPYYDICVWSQTHWRWLEAKLVEIGMIGGDRNYKVSFVSDRTVMFPIQSSRNGEVWQHEVKPLAYFWAQQPQWSAKNTIHIDDLSRNFAMNPGEGLKIRAFKGAGTLQGLEDRELVRLGRYLIGIAERCDDFRILDHAAWKELVRNPPPPPS